MAIVSNSCAVAIRIQGDSSVDVPALETPDYQAANAPRRAPRTTPYAGANVFGSLK